MANEFNAFAAIAPYLKHPLVLIGLVLMLFFGIHRQLLKEGTIPKLNQQQGNCIVRLLLHYGLWLALVIIILGFILAFYQTHLDHDPVSKRMEALIKVASGYCQNKDTSNMDELSRRDYFRACNQAIASLARQPDIPKSRKEDARG